MAVGDLSTEPWPASKSARRAGCYEYKNVRFRLSHSSVVSHGWTFQPFGRDSQEVSTWEEAIAAVEETCTEIARRRAERRNT